MALVTNVLDVTGAIFFFKGAVMFSMLKFVWILFKAFPDLLNVDRNALKFVPDQTKYLAMILLSLFGAWRLACTLGSCSQSATT